MFKSVIKLVNLWLHQSPVNVVIVITILGALLRIFWVIWIDPQPYTDFEVYRALAIQLAEGNGYSNQDGSPAGFFMVGYPFLLSVVIRIFGDHLIYLQLMNILFSTAAIPLSYLLARSFLTFRVSITVAMFVAVNPSFVLYSGVLATENPSVFMIMGIWYLGICKYAVRPTVLKSFVYGLLVAASVYVRPVAFVMLATVSVARWTTSNERSRVVVSFILALVIALIALAPWVIRNGSVMGWYTIHTEIGLNMWVGFSPEATGGWGAPPLPTSVSGLNRPKQQEDWSGSESNRWAQKAAVESILNDPMRVIKLIPAKVFHLWAGHRHAVTHSISASDTELPKFVRVILPIWTQSFLYGLMLLTILAFIKFPGFRFWIKFPANTVPISLLLWTLFHLTVFGAGRFHVPIEIALIMAASVAVNEIIRNHYRFPSFVEH